MAERVGYARLTADNHGDYSNDDDDDDDDGDDGDDDDDDDGTPVSTMSQ